MAIPSNATFSAGDTWFDKLNKSFVHVVVGDEDEIPTTDFLEAATALTTLFDELGSIAFTPVKNDMVGNIKKVRDRQLDAPGDSQNLQSLVLNELKTKKHTAAEGLLWLVRGLDFTSQAIRHNLKNPSDELSVSFRSAYSITLKPHHSFMVKPIFSAAMGATPYRKDFYAKLGADPEKVDEAAGKWLSALEKQVAILKQFQEKREAQW